MAKYTGRRIVPKHAGEWDIRKEYEELQIVLDADSGNSFISNLPVPKGTALSDEKYWSLFSLHSEQIAEAEEHLTRDGRRYPFRAFGNRKPDQQKCIRHGRPYQ